MAPPAGVIQFGVDANGCTVGPSGIVCPTGPVAFSSGAQGVEPPPPVHQPRTHHNNNHHQPHNQNVFVGLVGASGVIGPSGLVGPAGPVAFGK